MFRSLDIRPEGKESEQKRSRDFLTLIFS